MRTAAIISDRKGAAAAEAALILPLVLTLMFGAVELGNYFLSEHILLKAVRDGARYAARQDFSHYSACNGSVTDPLLSDTRTLVKTGLVSGGQDRLPYWAATTVQVTMSCSTTAGAGGIPLSGIYRGRASGAPIVTVSATVPYTPVLASFGFTGTGLNLNATQQAAVMGI